MNGRYQSVLDDVGKNVTWANVNPDLSPYGIPRSQWVNQWFHTFQHYVSDVDRHANEYDFKKALDLMHYIKKVSGEAAICRGSFNHGHCNWITYAGALTL